MSHQPLHMGDQRWGSINKTIKRESDAEVPQDGGNMDIASGCMTTYVPRPNSSSRSSAQSTRSNSSSFSGGGGGGRYGSIDTYTGAEQQLQSISSEQYGGNTPQASFKELQSSEDNDCYDLGTDSDFQMTEEDEKALRSFWVVENAPVIQQILDAAEKAKWKYISAEVSRERNKKITPSACSKKFKDLFGFAESSSVLGSSLPYVAHDDGWQCIENGAKIRKRSQ